MPRPRPASRIDVCNVMVKLNPLNQQHQAIENFKQGRFQYYAPTHSSAVAIGSTKLNPQPYRNNSQGHGEIHILDASTVVYSRGENGERTDVLIALADGCNKMPGEDKNSTTGLVAKAACDYITQEARSTDNADQLVTNAINAGRKSLEAQHNPDDKSSSTLNAAAINFNKSSFVNIGDGLLIVIDGTSGQVKEAINPKQILNATGKYVSATVQETHQMKYPQFYLEKNDCDLKAGDIVIMASRGLAAVLPSTKTKVLKFALNHSHSEKINYIEHKIQLDKLNNILLKVFQKIKEKYNNALPPAFAIADEFVNMTIALGFDQKQKKIAFAKDTEILIEKFKTDVIDRQNYEYQCTIKKIRAEIAANFALKKSQELTKTTETVQRISLDLPTHNLKKNNDISDSPEKKVERAISSDVHAVITASLSKLTEYSNKPPEELQTLTVSILKWSSIFFPGTHLLIQILENPRNVLTILGAIEPFIDKLKPIDNNHLDQCINLVTQNQNNFYEEPTKGLCTKKNMRTNDLTSTDQNYISYFAKQFVDKFQQIPIPTVKTIKDFKQWISDTRGPDGEYLGQLNEHLITMNINEAKSFRFLLNDLDINKMQFGDDTTIAVAYVPNPQLELVRAMIEYPNNHNQLWANLHKTNPTNETLEQIYHALRCERYINPAEQTNIAHHQTIGQKAEDLSHNIKYSYNEDELLDVEVFLLPKVKSLDRISNLTRQEAGETKETAQEKLNLLINYEGLSVLEMCCLYNEIPAAQFDILNQHRRIGFDNFFGIKITHTWSQTLKEIRDKALAKLRTEIDELLTAGRLDRALAILNKTLEAPLFNTHRSNFKITGAFGETAAVTEIRKLIDSVRAANNTQSYSL